MYQLQLKPLQGAVTGMSAEWSTVPHILQIVGVLPECVVLPDFKVTWWTVDDEPWGNSLGGLGRALSLSNISRFDSEMCLPVDLK